MGWLEGCPPTFPLFGLVGAFPGLEKLVSRYIPPIILSTHKADALSRFFCKLYTCSLVYRLRYIKALREPATIYPVKHIANLKPGEANRYPHKVNRPRPGEDDGVSSRLEDAIDLAP